MPNQPYIELGDVKILRENDVVAACITKDGYFEKESLQIWEGAGSGTYIDVGAYTGLYAINTAKRGNPVVAIEPNTVTYKRLLENATLNGVEIRAINAAIGDREGITHFALPVGKGGFTSAGTTGLKGVEVKMVSIDSLDLKDVVAIKMDVERAELKALEGAIEVIREYKPLLIIEALDQELEDQITSFLYALGYDEYRKADSRNLIFEG